MHKLIWLIPCKHGPCRCMPVVPHYGKAACYTGAPSAWYLSGLQLLLLSASFCQADEREIISLVHSASIGL